MKMPLRYYQDFLITLTQKEFSLRYRYTWLGFFWTIINPVLQMLSLGLVFKLFARVDIDHYFIFLFVGLVPWNFFSQSLHQTTPIIIAKRHLLTKSNFPKEFLPLSIILVNLLHFLVAMGIALVAVVMNYQLSWLKLLFVLLSLMWLVGFTGGLSLLVSAMTVYFRDINFIVKNFLPLLFYVTPILYTQEIAPAILQPLFYLNTMAGIIELIRFGLSITSTISLTLVGVNLLISCLIFVLGWYVFAHLKPYFVDKL
ncbi:ABC transporter permease [Patescibacteria group bacterium]|nr:ABC transporter permease [Patescibacteria group bacterium]